MDKEVSVSEILKGVAADVQVLKEVLKHDPADECEVPVGQEPAQLSQAVVVAAAPAVCVDPADAGVGMIGRLEARALGQRSPSPRRSPSPAYSPTSNDGSSSDSRAGEKHHRRISDKPKPASSRIPKKPEGKRPKPHAPLSPRPPKPKPTPQQRQAIAEERRALREKAGDLEDQKWHRQNCCQICQPASHWWCDCPVQYCVYCGLDQHRKVSWLDFETITCPRLLDKQERDREADQKAKAAQDARKARETNAFYEQWASERDRIYYDDMRRGGMYGNSPYRGSPNQGTRYNQQGQPCDSQNQRQRGNRDFDRSY